MTPPKLARELQTLLEAELTLLPGVGHMPMLEAPEATAAALQQWLERL
jgi:pimeloyl-ACP methyl ester carboxylesterase